MGIFLIIASVWTFGVTTLEEAHTICAPEPINKECFVEALEPIEDVDYSKLNG